MSEQVAADIDALAAEVHHRLEAVGEPERREVAKSYTPTAMRVLGVAVPISARSSAT